MLAHEVAHTLGILQVLQVSQLVDLVRANAAHVGDLLVPLQVLRGGSEEGQASARESDLGGRGHGPEAVRVARLLGDVQDVDDLRELVGQGVDGVGVIPHNAEVRRAGFHSSQGLGGLLREGDARRVGEHRHGPHALHGRVLRQLAHLIHVRAFVGHVDGQHLEAEQLGDGVVAVVARHGADPLQLLLRRPGALGIVVAEGVGPADQVEHDVQAGGIAGDDVIHRQAQDVRPQLADLRQADPAAVVAHIHSGGRGEVLARKAQQIHGEIQLLCRGLTAREVQVEPLGVQLFVGLADVLLHAEEELCVYVFDLHVNSLPLVACWGLPSVWLTFASLTDMPDTAPGKRAPAPQPRHLSACGATLRAIGYRRAKVHRVCIELPCVRSRRM